VVKWKAQEENGIVAYYKLVSNGRLKILSITTRTSVRIAGAPAEI
jgi:hypothetical protein